MTKFKKRLIKIGIMALMPILALLLCLNNTYAYYLDNDGNIRSNNLLDNSLFVENYGISSESGNLISINGYKATQEYIKFDSGIYSKTLGVEVFIYDSLYTYLTNIPKNTTSMDLSNYNDYVYCRFEALSSNNDLMINQGSNLLSYEPFGVWINQEEYETQKYLASLSSMYELFNGVEVRADNDDGEGHHASAILELPSNFSGVLTYDDLPSIITDYISLYSQYDFEITFIFRKFINASFYINSSYNDIKTTISYNLGGGFPLNDNYLRFYNLSNNTNNYLVDPNFSYKVLTIYYINDNHKDFNISLSYNNYFYRDGYNAGYQNGKNEGYDNGYNVGSTDGYNNGYNEGASTNLETNGMKTLFNSILSYPVNMIRSVFNFDFMGVNIASIIMFVISVGIVIFVVRKFKE